MRKLAFVVVIGSLSLGAFAIGGCGPATYTSAGVAVGPPVPSEADLYYDARTDSLWVEGRWVWNGYQYTWQPGYWIAARPGYVYIQGYWDYRGGHYYWTGGYWARARPGYVYARGYWGWHNGRRVWKRGRWQRKRPGHHWRSGYWDRSGSKRVWRPGSWKKGPRVRDHRRRGREKVPSRRGRRR
jgi:hypothetical protein